MQLSSESHDEVVVDGLGCREQLLVLRRLSIGSLPDSHVLQVVPGLCIDVCKVCARAHVERRAKKPGGAQKPEAAQHGVLYNSGEAPLSSYTEFQTPSERYPGFASSAVQEPGVGRRAEAAKSVVKLWPSVAFRAWRTCGRRICMAPLNDENKMHAPCAMTNDVYGIRSC
eukprot:scaffold1277_cov253-Pinguiococcus_pyrenoidosus.AAC.50